LTCQNFGGQSYRYVYNYHLLSVSVTWQQVTGTGCTDGRISGCGAV